MPTIREAAILPVITDFSKAVNYVIGAFNYWREIADTG